VFSFPFLNQVRRELVANATHTTDADVGGVYRVELHRQTRQDSHRLVADSVHTADVTRQLSHVSSVYWALLTERMYVVTV